MGTLASSFDIRPNWRMFKCALSSSRTQRSCCCIGVTQVLSFSIYENTWEYGEDSTQWNLRRKQESSSSPWKDKELYMKSGKENDLELCKRKISVGGKKIDKASFLWRTKTLMMRVIYECVVQNFTKSQNGQFIWSRFCFGGERNESAIFFTSVLPICQKENNCPRKSSLAIVCFDFSLKPKTARVTLVKTDPARISLQSLSPKKKTVKLRDTMRIWEATAFVRVVRDVCLPTKRPLCAVPP